MAQKQTEDKSREQKKQAQDELARYGQEMRRNRLRKSASSLFGKDYEKLPEEKQREVEDMVERALRFNIDIHCIDLMQGDPYFARLSQRIRKVASFQVPTAAMAYRNGEFALLYNPFFMADLKKEEVKGVLKHEFYHFTLGHITGRMRENARLWNIGTDLAINSLLLQGGTELPKRRLAPGERPEPPDEQALARMTEEEKIANEKMSDFLEQIEKNMSSEWYYEAVRRFCEKNGIPTEKQTCAACDAGIAKPMAGQPGGQGGDEKSKSGGGSGDEDGGEGQEQGGGSGGHDHDHGHDSDGPQHTCGGVAGLNPMDDHDGWGDVPEAEREFADSKQRKIVGEAVRQASQSNKWGSVPASMQSYLRERYSRQVDWKSLLRQFTGRVRGITRVPSIKRINRRYPYIHPGIKRGYTANLWIFVDMSGSVDDHSLELIFGELNNLARQLDVRLYPFDTQVREEKVMHWRKGTKKRPERVACGGTSFQSVVDFLDEKGGECDGALILSDGECYQPTPAPCRFGYIVVPGRKLLFEPRPNEIHIQMKTETAGGDW